MGGFIITFLKLSIKFIIKSIRFFGLYWFCVPFGIGIAYELIIGKNPFNQPIINFLLDTTYYMCFPLIVLTSIQNIIRIIKRDNQYNI